MMHKDLIRILHRKAAFAELCKTVTERFLGMDGASPQEQVLSEDSPYQHRFVSDDAWLEVLTMLQQLSLQEQAEAAQFKMVRSSDLAAVREKAIATMSGGKVQNESEAATVSGGEGQDGEGEGEGDAEDGGSVPH